MNKAILSTEDPQYAERLRALGYEIIPADVLPCHMPYERRHADLQCLLIDDTAFVPACCTGLINALSDRFHVIACAGDFGGKYPHNVRLNALRLENKLICRVPSLDNAVKVYCEQSGVELIHVKQGYTKCSCAVVADNAIITADHGIIRALERTSISVLPIGEGGIRLGGAYNGFIGGATGYDADRKTLYCCGDISRHPDYPAIKNYCASYGTKIVCLSDGVLTDIGGVVFC